MSRSPEYIQGRRAGVKWAITWLHQHALEMNDPHAKGILNTAGFNMGVDAKRAEQPAANLPFERIPQHESDPGFGPVPPRRIVNKKDSETPQRDDQ